MKQTLLQLDSVEKIAKLTKKHSLFNNDFVINDKIEYIYKKIKFIYFFFKGKIKIYLRKLFKVKEKTKKN